MQAGDGRAFCSRLVPVNLVEGFGRCPGRACPGLGKGANRNGRR